MKDSIQSGDLYAGLSLLRLQVFVAVAEHGGYSAAAASLDLAQPTVSFHIKALEQLLRAKLVIYRDRRVHLTAAGQELYRAASNMLRDAERVAAAVRSVDEGQTGHLRIGASIAFELPAFFERLLAPFRRDHPNVQLSLQFGHSVQLAEAVLEDQVDIAYVQNWRLPLGVNYEPLHHADFTLMVAPSHPLATKSHVTPQDVSDAGLITAPIHSQEWPHYQELLRRSGITRFRVSLEIDGVHARLLAAQAGLGVMGVFVPSFAAEDINALLRPVRTGATPATAEFGIVTPQDHDLSAAAEAFIACLRDLADGAVRRIG